MVLPRLRGVSPVRTRCAVLLLPLATPGAALAAAPTMAVRELPLRAIRQPAGVLAPTRFDLVGLHWQGHGSVRFRSRSLAGRWSRWQNARPEPEDRPDARSAETM